MPDLKGEAAGQVALDWANEQGGLKAVSDAWRRGDLDTTQAAWLARAWRHANGQDEDGLAYGTAERRAQREARQAEQRRVNALQAENASLRVALSNREASREGGRVFARRVRRQAPPTKSLVRRMLGR